MSVDKKRSRLAFAKLSRQLSRLAKKPAPATVHKFRTYGRRVEAQLDALVPHPNRNDLKLLKLLERLRKKAGQVRDLDVQITALRHLKILQNADGKSELIRALAEERVVREKKLARAFDKKALRELRRRLKRAAEAEIPLAANPLAIARRQLAALSQDHSPLTEKTLHRYRVVGKRARYLAELAADDPDAQPTIELLKRMQDLLGTWHDWLKLTEKAEAMYGTASDLPLVAALRNITRDKFRAAVEILAETRVTLSSRKPFARSARATAPTQAAAA